jgi:hypothetical protein
LIATAVATVYAAKQVKLSRAQLEQARAETAHVNRRNITEMSNQENWAQFDRREKLPAALPSWCELNDIEWAWRVLHLNHLNLLQVAYEGHKSGAMSADELRGWARKARFRFQHLWSKNLDDELIKGREVLGQLLQPEEGYSRDFVRWLVRSSIIPSDLISGMAA